MTSQGSWEEINTSEPVIGGPPRSNHGDESDMEDLQSTSIHNSYCIEWEKLFKRPNFLATLKSFGIHGKLRSSRFRSVCWKVFLEVLGHDSKRWLEETRYWRDKYDELKHDLITNPRKEMEGSNLSINNPLSQETESPWNLFFQDNELRVTIKQDVIRTFPELLFFQDGTVQERMTDILFCYAKQKSDLSYKQGMHELLAPLIFVLHCDHQAFLHACEIETVGDVIQEILNPDFVEHDAYAMFFQIMETVEPWYVSKEISPTVKYHGVKLSGPNTQREQRVECLKVLIQSLHIRNHGNQSLSLKISSQLDSQMKSVQHAIPFAQIRDLHPSNVIVTKLTRIQDYLLKKWDIELHAHLERMDIPPQIYGIRWVRLLFGREFPMQDLLMLWDAIFADGISFDLVDYVFLGMLLYIRDAMLTSDYPSCLHLLMKYPPVGDVHYFVNKALYLREPRLHAKPNTYTYQKPANFGHEWEMGGNRQHRNRHRPNRNGQLNIAEKAATVVSGFSTWTWKMNKGRRLHQYSSTAAPSRMSKSTSEPMNLITDQSPEEPVTHHTRKGSTASLSQLEMSHDYSHMPLRPAASTQSLARMELSSGRSASSMSTSMSRYDTSPPDSGNHNRYSSLPGRSKRLSSRSTSMPVEDMRSEQETALILGRLNDLESLCQKCAEKMGGHIDKLQKEMLSQQMENEDELLLALAGLKQVRDVLKGTLKPGSVFNSEEISIHEDHYQDDVTSASQPDSRRSSGLASPASGAGFSDHAEALTYSSGDPLAYSSGPDTDTSAPVPQDTYGYPDSSSYSSPDSSPLSNGVRDDDNSSPYEEVQSPPIPHPALPIPKEVELCDFIERPEEPVERAPTPINLGGHLSHLTQDRLASYDQDITQWSLSNNNSQISGKHLFHTKQDMSTNQNLDGRQHSIDSPEERPGRPLQRYHSAPPTPLDSVNTVLEDYNQGPPSPGLSQQQNYHRPQIVLSRKLSGGSLTEPITNSKRGPTATLTSFWGQRSNPGSRDPSPMNKLTGLFRGAFSKF